MNRNNNNRSNSHQNNNSNQQHHNQHRQDRQGGGGGSGGYQQRRDNHHQGGGGGGGGSREKDNNKPNRPSATSAAPAAPPAASAPTAPSSILKKAITPQQPIGSSAGESKTDPTPAEAKKLETVGGKSNGTDLDQPQFGVLFSLRPAFGFIQSITVEDSYYFSEREFYRDMKLGDLVTYYLKNGPKGLAAQNVRFLSTSNNVIEMSELLKGTIIRSTDRHRSNYGLIEIDFPKDFPNEALKNAVLAKSKNSIPFS